MAFSFQLICVIKPKVNIHVEALEEDTEMKRNQCGILYLLIHILQHDHNGAMYNCSTTPSNKAVIMMLISRKEQRWWMELDQFILQGAVTVRQ